MKNRFWFLLVLGVVLLAPAAFADHDYCALCEPYTPLWCRASWYEDGWMVCDMYPCGEFPGICGCDVWGGSCTHGANLEQRPLGEEMRIADVRVWRGNELKPRQSGVRLASAVVRGVRAR